MCQRLSHVTFNIFDRGPFQYFAFNFICSLSIAQDKNRNTFSINLTHWPSLSKSLKAEVISDSQIVPLLSASILLNIFAMTSPSAIFKMSVLIIVVKWSRDKRLQRDTRGRLCRTTVNALFTCSGALYVQWPVHCVYSRVLTADTWRQWRKMWRKLA